MNIPQPQALEAIRDRPIVSAILIILLALLILAASGHRGEDRSRGFWSTVDAWETSSVAVITTDPQAPGS